MSGSKPLALIYLHEVLGRSKTFVKAHVENLRSYRCAVVGARRVSGLELPDTPTRVVNNGSTGGRILELAFRQWGYAPGLDRWLGESRPAVVHAHHGTSAPTALHLARRAHAPLVVTFHGRDATLTREKARTSLRGRQLLRAQQAIEAEAASFIAVSDHIHRCLLERGYPREKVVTHYNGIDTDLFAPDPALERSPSILFVGRIVEKKGLTHLLQAMAAVNARLPNVQLNVIGDGPLKAELEQSSSARRGNCRFLGFLGSSEIRRWMNRSSLLVAPSVTARNGDSEGMPTVLLEAQSMGLPVVSTWHSGIPECVDDGVTGYLCPEADPECLADRIVAVLDDPARRAAMGASARALMLRKFSMQQQIRGLEAIYDEAVAAARAQAGAEARA